MRDRARSVRQRDDDADRSMMLGEVLVYRVQLFIVRCSKILKTSNNMHLKILLYTSIQLRFTGKYYPTFIN